MPSPSRANSSEPARVLIAAPSGRALAQAARAAGYMPLVADFFDDLDTREAAFANRVIEGDFARGFEMASLLPALEALADAHSPTGLIYGAGFEDRIDLLEALAARWPLIGNPPAIVACVKDPVRLSALCVECGIPHPEIMYDRPSEDEDWLIKHAGGSGGVHVSAADDSLLAGGDYYQRRVAGRPVSSLLLADGTSAIVLGFSEQWHAPAPTQPWRFGGAARPANLSPALTETLGKASRDIAAKAQMVGLNSIDFLVDGESFHLIEINPRPGATLDIFRDAEGRLLRAHAEASQGHLPSTPLRFAEAEAAAFVFAPFAIAAMPAIDWPDWTADRQKPDSAVGEHDPLCTVLAEAADLASVRQLLNARAAQILTLVTTSLSKKDAAA